MIGELSSAQHLLLRCCADPEGGHAAGLEEFGDSEVREIEALALRSRTFGLLDYGWQRSAELPVHIGAFSERLAGYARRQALDSLQQGRAIARVVAILREAGFRPIALKGLALAFGAYPAPQLRPLRDVDFLLEAGDALAAQKLLLAHPNYRRASWAGRYGVEYGHQLPEIEDTERGLVIELHHRLNARGWEQEGGLLAMIRDEAGTVMLLGEEMRVPSPHANFLHLLEHATLHHAFANGPLTLADFHFLASEAKLDWDRVERDCARLELGRALQVVVALAHALGARWMPGSLAERSEVASPLVLAAARAMLASDEAVESHAQQRRLARRSGMGSGPFAAISRVLQPDRYQLAKLSGRSPDSLWRWLGYPAWLAEKGARYWKGANDDELVATALERDRLIDWLDG
ncbi:nucleotidyltransferase family protein [Altererythrobacter sp. Z27]|uniref:nucleotidyltransferase family protein n=1 Tax=Altererythrobacter sp. Z27 TaxID=3461147 RepID=UPI004044B71F